MPGVGARVRRDAAHEPARLRQPAKSEAPLQAAIRSVVRSTSLTHTTMIESVLWPLANKAMWWRRLHRPEISLPYTLYGDTPRYQWPALNGRLSARSTVYSFGLGQNASFELELMRSCGCQIYGFDPTPSSAEWVASQDFGPSFHFVEIGIADVDGELKFFAPENPDHISYSIRPGKSARIGRNFGTSTTKDGVTAQVRTLPSIMRMLGHTAIDMLKMDIEGAEDKVIEAVAATDIRPPQSLVEFHHGFYGIGREDVMESVSKVKRMGYRIFWVSDRGLEYAFVHDSSV